MFKPYLLALAPLLSLSACGGKADHKPEDAPASQAMPMESDTPSPDTVPDTAPETPAPQ